jgi:hypothetical protein
MRESWTTAPKVCVYSRANYGNLNDVVWRGPTPGCKG